MKSKPFETISLLCLLLLFLTGDSLGQLITQPQARRVGLTRKWTSQATMTSSESTLQQILLKGDTLFSITDTGQLQAYNAETGATLWMVQVGKRDLLTLQMDASKNYVATINGSTIYVYNRFNGKLLWNGDVDIVPSAGPVVSDSRVYIPGINGRVQSFALRLITDSLKEFGKDEKTLTPEEREQLEVERRDSLRIDDQYVEPLNCQSIGRIFMQPVISRADEKENIDNIVWATDRGDLNLGSIRTNSPDKFAIKFFVKTGKNISSRPAVIEYNRDKAEETGLIYLASRDGYVYCVREMNGDQLWEYPCNEPIIENLAAVSWDVPAEKNKKKTLRRIYVFTYQRGMFTLDAITGEKLWQTPGIKRFLAQTTTRIYTVDYRNNLTVLDMNSGQVLGSFPLGSNTVQYLNETTDRIYLATDTGMIQCLNQMDIEKPIYFRDNPNPPKEETRNLMGDSEEGQEGNEEDSEGGESGEDVFNELPGTDDGDDAGGDFGGDDFGGDDAGGDDAEAGDDFGGDDFGGDDAGAAGTEDEGGAAPADAGEADPFGGAGDEEDPFL